jgi:hypothetical protein
VDASVLSIPRLRGTQLLVIYGILLIQKFSVKVFPE